MRVKLKPIIVLLVISMLFVAGCTLGADPAKLATGKYVAKIDEMKDLKPWVQLSSDNQFVFNRGGVLSYHPSGTYSIEKDTLVLTASPKEIFKFKIKGDTLVFESGEQAERFTLKGTVFELVKNP